MRIQITGRQIDIGDALQTHARGALDAIMAKYSQRPTGAQVIFSRSGHEYCCEASVHLSSGMTAQASARAGEIYAAFDAAAERMDKQLRRYRRRLKDHHARARPIESRAAAGYVLAAGGWDEDDQGEGAASEADGAEPDTLQPVIVAEVEARVPTLSVGEAVMQMEIAGAPALVFRNEKTDGLNVVYRREDGNIGWIDPGQGQGQSEGAAG